jgi:hypothetical protein
VPSHHIKNFLFIVIHSGRPSKERRNSGFIYRGLVVGRECKMITATRRTKKYAKFRTANGN